MPTVNDLKDSRFLTKEDCEPAIRVTIKGYEKMDVSLESQAADTKWCLLFKEVEKPLVLNSTNGQRIALITGKDDFEDWVGQKITLFNDKTVSFAGKITGGIRVKVPEQTVEVPDDEVPF